MMARKFKLLYYYTEYKWHLFNTKPVHNLMARKFKLLQETIRIAFSTH